MGASVIGLVGGVNGNLFGGMQVARDPSGARRLFADEARAVVSCLRLIGERMYKMLVSAV
jgi:hypothetical protein